MKTMTPVMMRKGYATGILSGMTWGLDTVLIGVAIAMTPFVENPVLLIGGTVICSMLHDVFAALWMLVIMGYKGRLKDLIPAIKSKDGLFCVLGALFGGPLAMTFYMLAIAKGGAALTAIVTACYPLLGSAMAMVILKEKVRLRGWLGLLICILGIIYIGYTPGSEADVNVIGGIMLATVAAIGWATEGVVCGYGMKDGNVDPQLALLIRELTSGIVYLLIVAPLMVGGYKEMVIGTMAVFSDTICWLTLLFTALIGMSSFFCWYTAIDLIGAAKALCLNVTYSFWAVVFTFFLVGTVLSINIIVGSFMVVGGVAVATLVSRKKG
jgi:transporter, drug/metabolite exporter family